MKHSFRKRLVSVVIGAAAAAATASASAAVTFFFPVTGFEDDDLAWVLQPDGQGGFNDVITGTLNEGDRIRGVLEFNNTNAVGVPGSSTDVGPQELAGIYDLTIATKTAVGGGLFNYTFIPTVGEFGNTTAGLGTFIRLWLSPENLDVIGVNCASRLACEGLASDGTIWADLGFNGDVNEGFFVTNMSDNIGLLASIRSNVTVANEQFYLNILDNQTGVQFSPQLCTGIAPVPFTCPAGGDGMVDVIGSGTLLGGADVVGLNGAVLKSDVQAQVAPIPEPGMLALIASGLLGMGFLRRRLG